MYTFGPAEQPTNSARHSIAGYLVCAAQRSQKSTRCWSQTTNKMSNGMCVVTATPRSKKKKTDGTQMELRTFIHGPIHLAAESYLWRNCSLFAFSI